MPNSIKLKKPNTYLDSKTIIYNKRTLYDILNQCEAIYNMDLNEYHGEIKIGYGNHMQNTPYGDGSGWCLNFPHPWAYSHYNKQIFMPQGGQELWMRDMNNQVWSDWKQII